MGNGMLTRMQHLHGEGSNPRARFTFSSPSYFLPPSVSNAIDKLETWTHESHYEFTGEDSKAWLKARLLSFRYSISGLVVGLIAGGTASARVKQRLPKFACVAVPTLLGYGVGGYLSGSESMRLMCEPKTQLSSKLQILLREYAPNYDPRTENSRIDDIDVEAFRETWRTRTGLATNTHTSTYASNWQDDSSVVVGGDVDNDYIPTRPRYYSPTKARRLDEKRRKERAWVREQKEEEAY